MVHRHPEQQKSLVAHAEQAAFAGKPGLALMAISRRMHPLVAVCGSVTILSRTR